MPGRTKPGWIPSLTQPERVGNSQGLSGMFAGGIWGGFGKGNPNVSIAESDFIYAVIGEELPGCVVLVGFYLIFFHQCYRVAISADTFDSFWLASLPFGPVRPCSTWEATKAIPMTGIHCRWSAMVGAIW